MPTVDVTTLGVWPLIAFFIPLVVSLVKQSGFTTQANAIIALLVYVISGILYVVIAVPQPWTVDAVLASVTTAILVGQAAYKLFWSNLGVSLPGDKSVEQRLTSATSLLK